MYAREVIIGALAAILCTMPVASGSAQEVTGSLATRLLATRTDLQAELERLTALRNPSDDQRRAVTRIRTRLDAGDFRPGDRIVIAVTDEPALTDTFTVTGDRTLELPPPTTRPMNLDGVLRSELGDHTERYLNEFLVDAAVRVQPLVRLSVHGEVARGGFHGLPPSAALADLLVAAGGTTPRADVEDMRLERDGETILEKDALRRAFADGRTIDQAYLQGGEQLIVESQGRGGLEENLRFIWVIVSLAGGIYGLSRAF